MITSGQLALLQFPFIMLHIIVMESKVERAEKKTKRSWTYMRENGVDSPFLFLH